MERMSKSNALTANIKKEIQILASGLAKIRMIQNHVVMVSTQERTDNCSLITNKLSVKTMLELMRKSYAKTAIHKKEIQILASGIAKIHQMENRVVMVSTQE
jgi:hypothetical protein